MDFRGGPAVAQCPRLSGFQCLDGCPGWVEESWVGATHPLTPSLYARPCLGGRGWGRREVPLPPPHTSYSFYSLFCFLQRTLLSCLPLRTFSRLFPPHAFSLHPCLASSNDPGTDICQTWRPGAGFCFRSTQFFPAQPALANSVFPAPRDSWSQKPSLP